MAVFATAACPSGRRRVFAPCRAGATGLLTLMVLAAGPFVGPAGAQLDRHTPTLRYHAAFGDFYEGEYRDALDVFRDEVRGAIKTPQSRWIDSICYETMSASATTRWGTCSRPWNTTRQRCRSFRVSPTG